MQTFSADKTSKEFYRNTYPYDFPNFQQIAVKFNFFVTTKFLKLELLIKNEMTF